MEKEAKELKKLSYSELENAAQQLSIQVKQLETRNNQLLEVINQNNVQNILKRLEWLWNIMHTDNTYLTEEFKQRCAKEFMDIMAQPEETQE